LDNIVNTLVKTVNSNEETILIKNFSFNQNKENELLFFLKPECFLYGEKIFKRIIDTILNKIKDFDIDLSGILVLSGKCLEKMGSMDRHYGFINTLSKNASKIVTDAEKEIIGKRLSIDNINEYLFLGGHEFLNTFTTYTTESLDTLWLSEKSDKIRSGYYVRKIVVEEKNIILINGFHPAQLSHFIDTKHKIALFLLHSDRNWKELKRDFAGDTFPEKAKLNSIRGELYNQKEELGLSDVSIANNFMHLSAGPFEAFFEINNFLSTSELVKYRPDSTKIYQYMKKKGIHEDRIMKVIANPTILKNNSQIDLFTCTEDMDTSNAVDEYIK
jgi:hypothetical protein